VSSRSLIFSRAAAFLCASSRSLVEGLAPTSLHREPVRDDPYLSRQERRFPGNAAAFVAARPPGPPREAIEYQRVWFS
jgi:hypothetical protein